MEDVIGDARLLAALRAASGDARAEFAESPAPLPGGFETTTLAFRLQTDGPGWGRPLVLRMFDRPTTQQAVLAEVAAMRVARAGGVPVPEVVAVWPTASTIGAAAIAMERLRGGTLLDDLFPTGLPKLVPTIARLQAQLHAIELADAETRDVPTYQDQLAMLGNRIESARLDGLSEGLAWLHERAPRPASLVLCHGDFHALNVISDHGTVTGVIDWSLVTLAEPELDVGSTRILMAYAPVAAGVLSGMIRVFQRHVLARRYLRRCRALRPLDDARVRYYEAFRCLRALVWAAEQREPGAVARETPWSSPKVSQRLARHFRDVSGVVVAV
jgi:aminoglycoside phosphotransferase (APT) family kinase protein